MQPDPHLHVEERFGAEDMCALARLYRRSGAPRPPDEAGIRHLLAESDLALALRAENPNGSISIVAFASALTDFCRDAVILDVLAEPDAPWPAAKLRAEIVSAIVSHPLLREVSRIEVMPSRALARNLSSAAPIGIFRMRPRNSPDPSLA